jgi:hypothetical protein
MWCRHWEVQEKRMSTPMLLFDKIAGFPGKERKDIVEIK